MATHGCVCALTLLVGIRLQSEHCEFVIYSCIVTICMSIWPDVRLPLMHVTCVSITSTSHSYVDVYENFAHIGCYKQNGRLRETQLVIYKHGSQGDGFQLIRSRKLNLFLSILD